MSDYLATPPPISITDRRANSQLPPDPFTSFTSTAFPKTLHDGFRWIERIILRNGHYREAIRRLVAYFVTEIVITDKDGQDNVSQEIQSKYIDFLEDTLNIRAELGYAGEDWSIYGNYIGSVLQRFESYLTCKACGFQQPFERAAESSACNLQFANWKYRGVCQRCKSNAEFNRVNNRIPGPEGIWIRRWSPYEINITYSRINDARRYYWQIPEQTRSGVRSPGPGKWWELQNAPEEVVTAVQKNEVIRLHPKLIFHARDEAPAGIDTGGWGFSRVLSNFSQAWYYQVLSKANETVASGYAVPMPVVTPASPGTSTVVGEPLYAHYNPQDFAAQVSQMVAQHRKQANSLYTLPVPVNFQLFGGDLDKIISEDQLEAALGRLLDCIGIPVQLYRGDLTMETAVPAMRLHEAYHAPLVNMLNRVLQKAVDAAASLLNWEPVQATLKPVRHADDVSRSAMLQQLAINGKISDSTALSALGINAKDEAKKIVEDQMRTAEMQAEAQQKLTEMETMMSLTRQPGDPAMLPINQAMMALQPPGGAAGAPAGAGGAAGAAPPAGGAAGGMGAPAGAPGMMAGPPQGAAAMYNSTALNMGSQPMTVQELNDKATGIAQLVLSWPDTQRRGYLANLKRREPQLHAIVSSIIDDQRRQAELQGRDAIMQQQFGAA